jgi:hypothetical protein
LPVQADFEGKIIVEVAALAERGEDGRPRFRFGRISVAVRPAAKGDRGSNG